MARVAVRPAGIASLGPTSTGELGGLAAQITGAWVGLTFFLAAVAVSLYLVQVSSMATAGYELQKLEAERDGWLARNEQLEYELAKRRSLPWVEAQAAERLGLVRPAPAAAIQVHPPTTGPGAPPASVSSKSAVAAAAGRAAPGKNAVSPKPNPGDPALFVAALRNWLSVVSGR